LNKSVSLNKYRLAKFIAAVAQNPEHTLLTFIVK